MITSKLRDMFRAKPTPVILVEITPHGGKEPIYLANGHRVIQHDGKQFDPLSFEIVLPASGADAEIQMSDPLGLMKLMDGTQVKLWVVMDDEPDEIIHTAGTFTFRYDRPGVGELLTA